METLMFRKMVLLVLIMVIMMGNIANSKLHNVGGSRISWNPNVNFIQWSIHQHFHVADWLCKFFSFIESRCSCYVVMEDNGYIAHWYDINFGKGCLNLHLIHRKLLELL
ncbi:hypothetical protein Lalb_Chr10g0105961 [Lupinus albus]|uniref:S-protein homolog n=1 Tax=Lupinus albus TaxID=3870 RepID=A0A6A4PWY7_LUPAL|nr:hypothetical protein Lalb_Chr10g0105961 [Lupinus albus]